MAEIVPFPAQRRIAYLRRNGELASTYRDPLKYLEALIDKHTAKLQRVGVNPDLAAKDIAALRSGLYYHAGASLSKVGGDVA
jgi:hypothetical protein